MFLKVDSTSLEFEEFCDICYVGQSAKKGKLHNTIFFYKCVYTYIYHLSVIFLVAVWFLKTVQMICNTSALILVLWFSSEYVYECI